MKIIFNIDYTARWGETLHIAGSLPELGGKDKDLALPMTCQNISKWSIEIEVEGLARATNIQYFFLVKDEKEKTIRSEWGCHFVRIIPQDDLYEIDSIWLDKPDTSFLSSPFKDCFFSHRKKRLSPISQKSSLIKVYCYEVEHDQTIAILGADSLGNWGTSNASLFTSTGYGIWEAPIPHVYIPTEYKFAIINRTTKEIIRWEAGANRILEPISTDNRKRLIETFFNNGDYKWKCAGVAIPVFSLKTQNSFGVGEFPDLKKMIDWAALVGQKIIQVLPINDTSMTDTWRDSYPYNAISIYALHPIYLGLYEYPLKKKNRMKYFLQRGAKLNSLKTLDYEQVIKLKKEYIHELFEEQGKDIILENSYSEFVTKNQQWLFSYACFCYLRDQNNTANYRVWKRFSTYNKNELSKLLTVNKQADLYIQKVYFTQYLLQKQLKEVRGYGLKKGVVLKGDIPIGISRDSVEAWVEPHLFNLDTQTGAPPDDFSLDGQNWGFPTYNWEEMSKDGYQWWKRRFQKMAEYFDVYRIDHILGFFRIWEIPLSAVQGLLGYFSPALPYGIDEIKEKGLSLPENRLLAPFIDSEFIQQIFEDRVSYVKENYLDEIGENTYQLKPEVSTQQKIKNLVSDSNLRAGLYQLCANILFIQDKKNYRKLHPRISAQKTYSYKQLNSEEKRAFDSLYEDFFFHRHSTYWKEEAMRKLPALIASTEMLVCGEDLGMIPSSVPEVMQNLDILSLEIQRMPKTFGVEFEDLSRIPYKSVCATSTHDMSPIRLWWKEDKSRSQSYYSYILKEEGESPIDCSAELCEKIINIHLESPAMLVINPLQDWLSLDTSVRRDNEEEEQINIPANSNHYWQYRMHLYIEDMIRAQSLNDKITEILLKHKR